MSRPFLTSLERLELHAVPEALTGCWLWHGAVQPFGQGVTTVFENGKHRSRLAHRVAWTVHHGSIPEGMYVLHKCDVPACVNPDHLFLGTQADNLADMRRKGRAPSTAGERHGNCRLSDAAIRAIMRDGSLQSTIAAVYGIHPSTVSKIKAGKTRIKTTNDARIAEHKDPFPDQCGR